MRDETTKPRVLIIGIGGQDAQILAKLYTQDSAIVFGVSRTAIHPSLRLNDVSYLVEDLSNPANFAQVLGAINPDFVFHLAAIHGSNTEMKQVEQKLSTEMRQCHVEITRNILNWQSKRSHVKSLFALSSFLYTPSAPRQLIDLSTNFQPQGIYGQTKLEALNLIRTYRDNYHVKSVGAILFNHSSVYSKPAFLIPSIARNLTEILGNKGPIKINNSERLVDISRAENFCEAFKSLMKTSADKDYIFSSGKLESIRNLYEQSLVRVAPHLLEQVLFDNRGTDLPSMYGDTSEISAIIDWKGGGDLSETILEIAEIKSRYK